MTDADTDTGTGTERDTDVACSLDEQDAEKTREWARTNLVPHVEATEALDDGVALVFDAAAFDAVATHVQAESGCCAFADFRIDYHHPHDTVRLEVTGPDGAAELFQEGYLDAFDEVPQPT